MSEPQLLAADLVIGESARWHDGRVWLSNWGAQEILAFDQEGNREVITRVPTTIPFSIDWLPDGQLLVVAGPEQRLLRQQPDGSLVDRQAFLKQTAVPIRISNLQAHDVQVRIMGDFAIIHARTTYTLPDGRAGQGRYTDVWARRNGRWLAVSAHVTRC